MTTRMERLEVENLPHLDAKAVIIHASLGEDSGSDVCLESLETSSE
jgi:hypothetical protein